MSHLKFFYSPGSRYSYLALTQMSRLEEEFSVSFDWIPTVGARIREIRGADPFKGPPQSGQYDWAYRERDAKAWADYYGVFGNPSFCVSEKLFWGQDRLVLVRHALEKWVTSSK